MYVHIISDIKLNHLSLQDVTQAGARPDTASLVATTIASNMVACFEPQHLLDTRTSCAQVWWTDVHACKSLYKHYRRSKCTHKCHAHIGIRRHVA